MRLMLYMAFLLTVFCCSCKKVITKKFSDGSKYTGELKNGSPEGFGRMTYPDGGFYEGEWRNGLQNGYGVMVFDTIECSGVFVNGKIEGLGTAVYPNGDKYKGYMLGYDANGWGTYVFGNHKLYDRYIGNYKNSSFNGLGIFIFKNKSRYEGQFVNQNFNGWGVYIDSMNIKTYGKWKDGKLVSECNRCLNFDSLKAVMNPWLSYALKME